MRYNEVKSELQIERNGEELVVAISGRYTPAFAGCWYRRNGDPGDPPEPAEVEDIECPDGYELTEAELEQAREKLLESAAELQSCEFERD